MDSTLDKYSPLPGDTIDAKLEEGEFVLNRNAVDALGVENLKEFNDEVEPRFMSAGGEARRRKAEDDRIVAQGKKLAMIDQAKAMQAPLQLRKINVEPKIEKVARRDEHVGWQPPTQKQSLNHMQRLVHSTRLKQDPEYASKFNQHSELDIKRDNKIPIDLQKVEVPMGDQFNADEFNNMMSATKTLNDFFVRQGMDDSQGRTPMDADYGQIKGIDPKNWKMPTNRMLTPAEQLMAQMNQKRNKDYNTHIDEDNPAIAQVYKDNPLMEAERLDRRDNLQQWSDDRTQKLKDDIALEYSPNALHNWDTDGIGGSKADAMKRQADRELAQEQSQEIAMMNPGSQPAYYTKDGQRMDKREDYIKYRQGERAKEVARQADLMMSKDGQLRGGSKKAEAKWQKDQDDKMMTLVKSSFPKGTKPKGLAALRAKARDFSEGWARGKHGTLDDKYDYQTGGKVLHYNLGDLVKQGQETWGDITGAVSGGANAIADAARERYGGGFRKERNLAAERYLGELDDIGGEKFADMDREQQVAMSKELRETGGVEHIMTDQEKGQMWGEGLQEVKEQLGKDVKALPGLAVKGALGTGAAALGAGAIGAKKLYEGGKQLYKEGFDKDVEGGLLKDAAHHLNKGEAEKYADVWSGQEKGSMMQRGRKGLGMLGMMLKDASKAQGFEGADWAGSGLGFKGAPGGKKVAKEQVDAEKKSSGNEQELNMDIIEGKTKPTSEIIEESDYNPENAKLQPVESQVTTSVDADGNPTTIDTGSGVIQDINTGTISAASSTSGGNTNILNDPNVQISDNVPDWLNQMTGAPSSEPGHGDGSGVLAPEHNPYMAEDKPFYDPMTGEFNMGGNQRGGPVTLEGFIQQSWRNM